MTYKREFPDFDYEIPFLGNGWVDSSWHNDVSPSFEYHCKDGHIYRLWFDYLNPDQREVGGSQFVLSEYSNDESLGYIFESDDLNEVIDRFNTYKGKS